MKISQIIQETITTAGSIAPSVEHGFVKMQTRNPSVYGNTKAGNLLKGKKTNKAFANSVNESAELSEADLQEDDIIVLPGQGRTRKTGFTKHGQSRVDHEVEMARSDVLATMKNARVIYELLKNKSEEEGLEGWVQEKLIKANDYLNSVKEYYDEKMMQQESVPPAGVIGNGAMGESSQRVDSLVTDALKIMRGSEASDAVKALKIVLGDREYSSRRGFYNFYIKQMLDMYGQQGVAEGEENKYGSQENWDSLRKDIKSQYPYKKGTTVTVPHKGKLVNGKIVRYEAGGGGYSPAYVVDIGEYESIMVQPNKVRRGATESLGTTGAMTNGEMGESQLDELSPKALGSYVKSASGDMANRKGDTQFQKGARVATSAFNSKLPASRFEKDAKIEKRQAGIDRAVDKITGKK